MLTVQFEKPPGTITGARRFEGGDLVRVGGSSSTDFGLPNSNCRVTLDLWGDGFSPVHLETHAGWGGGYHFDLTMPSVRGQADVMVVAYYWLNAHDQVTIPIGIGEDPTGDVVPITEPDALGQIVNVMLVFGIVILLSNLMGSLREVLPGDGSKKKALPEARRRDTGIQAEGGLQSKAPHG